MARWENSALQRMNQNLKKFSNGETVIKGLKVNKYRINTNQ